jgi:hypothetical protein
MLSVRTLLVLTVITIIISNPYYIVAASTLPKSSESVESAESHESHQSHNGSQSTTSHPDVSTLHDVSRVMSVVATKWRKYDIRSDGKIHSVSTIMSDITEKCAM